MEDCFDDAGTVRQQLHTSASPGQKATARRYRTSLVAAKGPILEESREERRCFKLFLGLNVKRCRPVRKGSEADMHAGKRGQIKMWRKEWVGFPTTK
jgi:hypothetical protein